MGVRVVVVVEGVGEQAAIGMVNLSDFSLGQVLWVPLLSSGHRPGIYTGIARRAALKGSTLLLLLSRLLLRGLAPQAAAAARPARVPQSEPFTEPRAVLWRREVQRVAVTARCQSEASGVGLKERAAAGKVRESARGQSVSVRSRTEGVWPVRSDGTVSVHSPDTGPDLGTRVRTRV